jgi:hypothetical protein
MRMRVGRQIDLGESNGQKILVDIDIEAIE